MNILYESSKRLVSTFFDVFHQTEAHGLEHIPRDGSFLLASNHVSFYDPPAAGSCIPGHMHYFARKTLFKPGLAEKILTSINCIPVDRDGASDVAAMRRVLKLLKTDASVLIFPEGTRSVDGSLQSAKRGIGLMACKAAVPIIPVRVFGSFEAFGRSQSKPRLYEPIHVVYGPALMPADYNPKTQQQDRYQYVADKIMEAIGEIPCPDFGGI